MPRNRAEFCMLCGSTPCACNSAQPKKATPRKALSAVPPPPSPAQPTPQQVVRSATPKRAGLTSVPKTAQPVETEDDVSVAQEREALTIVVKMMSIHPDDINRIRHELNMTPLEIDTLIWRRTRESQVNR